MNAEIVATLALLMAARNAFVAVNRLASSARQMGLSLAELCELPPLERTRNASICGSVVASALARLNAEDLEKARLILKRTAAQGIWMESRGSKGYPEILERQMGDAAPPILFGKGEHSLLQDDMAAIVGTRTPTKNGETLAADCAHWMARQGIAIVSGGAKGVDSAAHENAIAAGGHTLAVLPQGLLTHAASRAIAAGISEGKAVLISPFPPTAQWATHAAIMRNAIIAAFARCVCVVEPFREGGSVRTARFALSRGIPVFVAAPPVDNAAYDRLIKAGAQPMLTDNGELDRAALERAWEQETAVNSRQEQLPMS